MNPNKGSPAYAGAWRVITAYLGLVALAVMMIAVKALSA